MTTAITIDRKDHHNLSQVFPLLPAYLARLAELEAAGRYPYNDDFKGHLPGVAGKDEDTAIYRLQSLRGVHADAIKVNEAWDEGFRPLDPGTLSATPTKVRALVEFGWYMGGSGFRRSEEVRLVLYYGSVMVMAKRARTHGRMAQGELLVLP